MKRSSVAGPLILIVIGFLFLANNLRPDLSVLDMLSRYWPFLLIAWGVLRLVEIGVWATSKKVLPATGVSGGEWTFIVVLCLVGSGMFFVHQTVGRWPAGNIRMRGVEVFGESFDYEIREQKLPAARTIRVLVENFRGNARIRGGDADQVSVTGRKTIRAFDSSRAEEANNATPLELVQQGDLIVVRTNQQRASEDRRMSADLEISVPRGASVECRGRHGDFDVVGVNGNVEVVSDNSDVRMQDIGGNIRIDLRDSDVVRAVNVKGTVELKGRGDDVELENIQGLVTLNGGYSGELQFRNLAQSFRLNGLQTDIHVERCPGQIRMARGYFHAENVAGPLRISGRSKDIQITDFTNSLELQIERGDVDLRPGRVPLSALDVRTRSGNIELALPEGARFDLHAEAEKGEIENDYGEPLVRRMDGRTGVLTGSVGGGPKIGLTTNRGSITVRKGTTAAEMKRIPPRPPAAPEAPAAPLVLERN